MTPSPAQQALALRAGRALILKDSDAYRKLYDQLRQAYTRAWDDETRKAIAAAMDRAQDLGSTITPADQAQLMTVLENRIGGEAMAAVLRKPILNLGEALYRGGLAEIKDGLGIDIAFQRPDLDALEIVNKGNLFWVRESWGNFVEPALNQNLSEYFTTGLTRAQFAQKLEESLGKLLPAGRAYWTLLADHTATKTRELGRVAGYQRAGIKKVQVRARLDAKTSAICRHMHGRIIEVKALAAQRDTYLDAIARQDQPAAKAAWKLYGNAEASSLEGRKTSKLPSNTASPPYHFRCRTITVAYFETGASSEESTEAYAGWKRKLYDREPLSIKETAALIERSKGASWPHTKVVRGHYRQYLDRHAEYIPVESQSEFSQRAIDLIRRSNRDVYLSMRKGKLHAVFAERIQGAGRNRYATAIVDVEDNKLLSYHLKERLESSRDEIIAVKQPGRGIQKWRNIWQ